MIVLCMYNTHLSPTKLTFLNAVKQNQVSILIMILCFPCIDHTCILQGKIDLSTHLLQPLWTIYPLTTYLKCHHPFPVHLFSAYTCKGGTFCWQGTVGVQIVLGVFERLTRLRKMDNLPE